MENNRTNFLLIIIIAALSMAVAFIIIFMVLTRDTGSSSKTESTHKETSSEHKIDYKKAAQYSTGEMIINLKKSEGGSDQMLKIDVAVTLTDSKFLEEFKKRENDIKDYLYSYFTQKSADDLTDGKIDKLKPEVLEGIKKLFTEKEEVEKIYKVTFPVRLMQ